MSRVLSMRLAKQSMRLHESISRFILGRSEPGPTDRLTDAPRQNAASPLVDVLIAATLLVVGVLGLLAGLDTTNAGTATVRTQGATTLRRHVTKPAVGGSRCDRDRRRTWRRSGRPQRPQHRLRQHLYNSVRGFGAAGTCREITG
jgi:hypothetical protein